LNFLGFFRPNRAASMGYTGFSAEIFFDRLLRRGGSEMPAREIGMRKEQLFMRASLA
jgi:hypothetical protein